MVVRIIVLKITVISFFILTACGQNESVFNAKVSLSKPQNVISIDGEKVNIENTPVGISSIDVCDSIILLKASNSSSIYHLHAFSSVNYYDLGHYVAKGRGANELITPIVTNYEKTDTGDDIVSIYDLNQSSLYDFNLTESIKHHQTLLKPLTKFSSNALYAYPLESDFILFVPKDNDYVCTIIDKGGNNIKTISLCPNISGIRYFDKLASANIINADAKKVAMAILMLPQLNIFDLENEENKTFAVTKAYRNWKKILNLENAEQNIYYTDITRSQEYLISLYYGHSFMEWVKGENSYHIHVFDWNGNFIYDMAVKENLRSISYSSYDNMLYAVDINDEIYRYNFSSILP